MVSALIADDEANLARDLSRRLATQWPELKLLPPAENGLRALEVLHRERPEIAFLDIRMPGLSGIEVARQIRHPCLVVFVTAYDEYALAAFDAEAVDYLLKPVDDERLNEAVRRLQRHLRADVTQEPDQALLLRLKQLLDQVPGQQDPTLQWIRASSGEQIHLIAVDDVLYFQARDKYTSVLTRDAEYLIRSSIRALAAQLDAHRFWQVHRATLVNVSCIDAVERDFKGQLLLRLHGREELLSVSRRYASQFDRM